MYYRKQVPPLTLAFAVPSSSIWDDWGHAHAGFVLRDAAQLEQLKITAAEETAAAVESEAQLRQDIADALERFSAGALDADGFLDDLRDMGVQVDCTAEQLTLTCRYMRLSAAKGFQTMQMQMTNTRCIRIQKAHILG